MSADGTTVGIVDPLRDSNERLFIRYAHRDCNLSLKVLLERLRPSVHDAVLKADPKSDLIDDAWLNLCTRLIRGRDSYDPSRHTIKQWVAKLTEQAIQSEIRNRRRRAAKNGAGRIRPPEELPGGPEKRAYITRIHRQLNTSLAALDPRYRDIFLQYQEGEAGPAVNGVGEEEQERQKGEHGHHAYRPLAKPPEDFLTEDNPQNRQA